MTQKVVTNDEEVTWSQIFFGYFRYFWKVFNKSFVENVKKVENQPTLLYNLITFFKISYIDFLIYIHFNPNPHWFKAITKLTASGWKEPLLPHPLHSTVGGAGEGGCFLCSPEDKNVIYNHTFILWKTLKQKSLLRYFARLFWFWKCFAKPSVSLKKNLLIHKEWGLGLK
jgi:hypothetical protein